MFPKFILYLLYSFNLWGYCTELPELRMSRKWIRVIFVCQVICSFCFGVFVWFLLQQQFMQIDLLSITNFVIKLRGAVLCYLFIIVESYCQRHSQRTFWQIYRNIRSEFNRAGHPANFSSYLFRFVQFFVTVVGVELSFIAPFASYLDVTSSLCLFSYLSLLLMQQWRTFHYLFFIRLLDHQLDEVGVEMKMLADASETGTLSRDRLCWIRLYYDSVHELMNRINEVFGWSNVVCILYLFLRLVVDLNEFYRKYHESFEAKISRMFPSFISFCLTIFHNFFLLVFQFF